ncbi:hypothetical protein DFH07DRAFT_939344 [Mycena maculata]|uniref:Uncharacterized protein n=1 Tax=Mycena maculata TaxID=230809 RepID=A0AAD7JEH5_9AGAR|nr:hypothetical protein DFH07DRAFT_939344 [Mycena maculata]
MLLLSLAAMLQSPALTPIFNATTAVLGPNTTLGIVNQQISPDGFKRSCTGDARRVGVDKRSPPWLPLNLDLLTDLLLRTWERMNISACSGQYQATRGGNRGWEEGPVNQSFTPPTAPVLQILSKAQPAQSLLPAGSVYMLTLNKTVEISIPGKSKLNSKANSDADSAFDSEANSGTIIGVNPESVRIGVATPEQHLHQNRSRIAPTIDISANQATITWKIELPRNRVGLVSCTASHDIPFWEPCHESLGLNRLVNRTIAISFFDGNSHDFA